MDSKIRTLHFETDRDGIFEDEFNNIFNEQRSPLQMTTSTETGIENSTEIGLPFCKKVMWAFGGDIFVKSEPKKGTEFCLQF